MTDELAVSGKCPARGSDHLVVGQFVAMQGGPICFMPTEVRWWKRLLDSGAPLIASLPSGSPADACLACGHVWGRLHPEGVRRMIGDGTTSFRAKSS